MSTFNLQSAIRNPQLRKIADGRTRTGTGLLRRFEEVGYVAVRNPYEGEGRWKIGKNSYVIYAKKTLSKRDQITARKCIEEIKSRYPQP
jgi:hypothetical protein